MKMMNRVGAWASFVAVLVGACAGLGPSLALAQTADLTARMAAEGQLGQFVSALDSAGLSDTLRTGGPYTVWAPTDSAFAALSPQVRQRLQDPTVLKQVLQYHLAPGVVTAAEIVQVPNVRTIEGEQVKISASNGIVRINDSQVVQPDLMASNGIIHVINGILVPPSEIQALPLTGSAEEPAWPTLVTTLGLVLAAAGAVLRLSARSARRQLAASDAVDGREETLTRRIE